MEKVVSLFTVSLKKFKRPGILQFKKLIIILRWKLNQQKAWFNLSATSAQKKKTEIHSGQENKQIF